MNPLLFLVPAEQQRTMLLSRMEKSAGVPLGVDSTEFTGKP